MRFSPKRVKAPRTKRQTKPGTAPGSILGRTDSRAVINLISYKADYLTERTIHDVKELERLQGDQIHWLDFIGVDDETSLLEVGRIFGIHRLSLEDINHPRQHPKVEWYPDHCLIFMRMLSTSIHHPEQLAIILGKNYVITFQEHQGDSFQPVRERLQRKSGVIRDLPANYLAYAIIDANIDHLFPIIESYAEQIETIEEHLLSETQPLNLHTSYNIKASLDVLRRISWAHRNLLQTILRDGEQHFDQNTRAYLRDCYDHTVQQSEFIDTYKEGILNLIELNFNLANHKSNEIMKVLTIVASIFIPLTFIVGIYGMNFNPESSKYNMPELNMTYGYPITMVAMLVLALVMLIIFRKRKWF